MHFATKTNHQQGADIPTHMTIDEVEEVGIGTMTPGYKLQAGTAGDGTEAWAMHGI
jgi:hypothetical protein